MWSRFPTDIVALGLAAALLAACGSAPSVPDSGGGASVPAPAPQAPGPSPDSDDATADPSGGAAGAALPPPAVVPERAAAEFSRAVELMRGGQTGEAEIEFQQLAAGYPQLAG